MSTTFSTPAGSGSAPNPDAVTSVGQRLGGIAGGVLVSLLILIGIARAQKTSISAPPVPIEELRALAVDPPPPPPPTAAQELPAPPSMIELEPQPEAEGIKIAAVVRPQVLPVPTAMPQSFDLDMSAYRPRGESAEQQANRVYQPSEVDQRPVVLYRKVPQVTQAMLDRVKNPRVTLLFVVNVDGEVEKIHVLHTPNEEFAKAMTDAVREWRFRPAMKGGRKVRCMIQLPIFVRPPTRNPFSLE